jgi:hypothetical protein
MDDIARAFIYDSFLGVGNTDTPALLERTQQKADDIAGGNIAALRMVPVIPGRTPTWILSRYNMPSPPSVPVEGLDERVLNKLRSDGNLGAADTTVNLKDYVDEYRELHYQWAGDMALDFHDYVFPGLNGTMLVEFHNRIGDDDTVFDAAPKYGDTNPINSYMEGLDLLWRGSLEPELNVILIVPLDDC